MSGQLPHHKDTSSKHPKSSKSTPGQASSSGTHGQPGPSSSYTQPQQGGWSNNPIYPYPPGQNQAPQANIGGSSQYFYPPQAGGAQDRLLPPLDATRQYFVSTPDNNYQPTPRSHSAAQSLDPQGYAYPTGQAGYGPSGSGAQQPFLSGGYVPASGYHVPPPGPPQFMQQGQYPPPPQGNFQQQYANLSSQQAFPQGGSGPLPPAPVGSSRQQNVPIQGTSSGGSRKKPDPLLECPMCEDKKYSKRDDLKGHCSRKHPQRRLDSYEYCNYCEAFFNTPGDLIWHHESWHEHRRTEWVSAQSNVQGIGPGPSIQRANALEYESFPSAPQALVQPIVPSSFTCTACNSRSRTQNEYDAHMASAKHKRMVARAQTVAKSKK